MIVPAVLSQARGKQLCITLHVFFETMQNSRVAFIGTGVTNGDIIRLFRKKGIDVTLLDRKNPEQLGKVYTEFESLGVKFCLGTAIWIP